MNRRLIALLAVGLCAVTARQGLAQGTAAVVPTAAHSAASAEELATHRQAIEQFIDAQVARLTDTNPRNRAAGRDALIGEVQGSDITDAYRFAFGTALAAKIGPAITSSDLLTRLNAAVVVAKVSAKLPAPVLKPVIVKILQDKDPAVAHWGMKAATATIPQVAIAPVVANDPLITAIPVAVKTHKIGPMADEAYRALTLTAPLYPATTPIPSADLSAVAPRVMPAVLDVFESRVSQYNGGVPQDPKAEIRATLFVAQQPVWQSLSSADAKRAVAAMAKLMEGAAAQYGTLPSDQRPPLADVVSQTGKTIYVLAESAGMKKVLDAATPVTQISPASNPEAVTAAVAPLLEALKDGGGLSSATP